MNGIGGNHQPINLTPTDNNAKTQNTQSSQGILGRFKVSLPNIIKALFTGGGLAPSRAPDTSIHSRTVTAPPAAPPKSSAAGMKSGKVANTANEAKNSPAAQQSFKQIDKGMQRIQDLKKQLQQLRGQPTPSAQNARRAVGLEIKITREACKTSVDSFNKTVGPDLQINLSDLEMALGNEVQLDAGDKYPEFDQEFKALSTYRNMKAAFGK